MKRLALSLLAVIALIPVIAIGLQYFHDPGSNLRSVPVADIRQQVRQGAYLSRAGNCMACHTTRGGAEYAGGRAIHTPFGTLHSPNITPDPVNGIGRWNADDFWRALHNGRSRDGRFLYPAFPYTEYTRMTRADSDALFAYFRSLPAVPQPNQPHALRFPYNQRFLLAGWRAMYFRPGVFKTEPLQDAQWNRGAYLVQGPGHCIACHGSRNALGATGADQSGGQSGGMIGAGWYAPSLFSDAEAGVGNWNQQHVIGLLRDGISPTATVAGPMAEVVQQSLQHLTEADLGAMAVYLKSLSQAAPAVTVDEGKPASPPQAIMERGAKLYRDNCIACHQENGRGLAPGYPPLAGNRAVSMSSAVNPIRMILHGGFPPGTAGNPKPYGMPPYGPMLDDADVAAVLTYVRNAWGNRAPAVSAQEVSRYRAVPVD